MLDRSSRFPRRKARPQQFRRGQRERDSRAHNSIYRHSSHCCAEHDREIQVAKVRTRSGQKFASANRGIRQCRAQLPLHAFDPFAQRHRAVGTETDKEMHVIRHDHVTTDNYSEFRRMMAIFDESSMNRCPSQNLAPCMSVEGEQINRRLEPRKQPIYSGRFPFDLPLHKECCSARFPQRISN